MNRTKSDNPSNVIFIGKLCPETRLIDKLLGVKEHTHPFWEIVVYYEGSGTGCIGDKTYSFERGTAVAIPPGVPHRENSDVGYCVYFIYLPLLVANEEISIVNDSRGNIIKLTEAIYDIFMNKSHGYLGVANSIAFSVYDMIKTLCDEHKTSEHTQYFLQYIKDNLSNSNIDICAETQRYGISMHHLRYCFERDIGKTPNDYLIDCRMALARQMLSSSKMTVKSISEECGYRDYYYFSRCFKKYYGLSPREYKISVESRPDKYIGEHTVWKK